jgi:hypothetical protein
MFHFFIRKLQAPVLQALQHIKETIVSQLDTIETQISTLTTKLSNLEALTVELHTELLDLRNATAEANTAQRLNALITKLAQANDGIDNTLAAATEHAGSVVLAAGSSSAATFSHDPAVAAASTGVIDGGGFIGATADVGQDVQHTTASEQQATAVEAASTQNATTESTGTEASTGAEQ